MQVVNMAKAVWNCQTLAESETAEALGEPPPQRFRKRRQGSLRRGGDVEEVHHAGSVGWHPVVVRVPAKPVTSPIPAAARSDHLAPDQLVGVCG